MNAVSGHETLAETTFPGAMAGEVIESRADTLLVFRHSQTCEVRVAASCLLAPEPGDIVLIASVGDRTYALAVLERGSGAPIRLAAAQGDLEIAAPQGTLRLLGAKGLSLTSEAGLRADAARISVRAARARFMLDEVTHVGRSLVAQIGRLKLIGTAIETVFERVMSRARRSYRVVEEGDFLRSRDIDHRAEGTLHLRGHTTLVTAATLAKVDGGQIHLG